MLLYLKKNRPYGEKASEREEGEREIEAKGPGGAGARDWKENAVGL